MSQLTPCCYCTNVSLIERSRKKGLTVTLIPEGKWIAAYAHPPEIEVCYMAKENRQRYWRSSYAVLSTTCCC